MNVYEHSFWALKKPFKRDRVHTIRHRTLIIVDADYKLIRGYEVSSASQGDVTLLDNLLDKLGQVGNRLWPMRPITQKPLKGCYKKKGLLVQDGCGYLDTVLYREQLKKQHQRKPAFIQKCQLLEEV